MISLSFHPLKKIWNKLPTHIREYKLLYKAPVVPPVYIEGDRVSAVKHFRIIMIICSNLNSDLFTNNLTIIEHANMVL
jgi:hypothetical protein